MSEKDDWDELFDELYLRTYAGRETGDAEEEALGAVRVAGIQPGADVLDAPCGYGRHSVVLADAGYRVVGADRSPTLLDEARRRSGEADWPRWVEADHRELPFGDAEFDAVLCLFSSLGYRGEDDDRRTLAEFRRVLRPGGALVVETMHRDRLMTIFVAKDWEPLAGGASLLEERRFDPVRGVTQVDHILVESDGTRRGVSYELRLYTATELADLVRAAGFADVECFGGWEREPLTADTRLVLVGHTLGP